MPASGRQSSREPVAPTRPACSQYRHRRDPARVLFARLLRLSYGSRDESRSAPPCCVRLAGAGCVAMETALPGGDGDGMLPDLRFVIGATLATAVLGLTAIGLLTAAR